MAVGSTSNTNSALTGTYSRMVRVTGMASGIDTEGIIKSIMQTESASFNRLDQKKQKVEWKTAAYRDVINSLRAFKDEFYNNLKMSSNFLSKSALQKYKAVASNSDIVSAVATADASAGSHTIEVRQLAKAANIKSTDNITKGITGSRDISYGGLEGKKFSVNLDGITKEITISSSSSNASQLKADLQASINKAFGDNKVLVNIDNNKISFSTVADSGVTKLSVYSSSSESKDAFSMLGFDMNSNISNRINTNNTLATLSKNMSGLTFDSSNNVSLNINGKEFKFSSTTTLAAMMDKINSDTDAGVTMSYDDIKDRITITAKQTGSQNSAEISETGSTFLKAAKIFDNSGLISSAYTPGQDAKIVYDGDQGNIITRSSNDISLNGVKYTLKKESAAGVPETVTTEQDTDEIFKNIKSFVDKYNEIIADINGKLSEKFDRDYQPLTSDQKSQMTEKEIEAWEAKAKKGILRSDDQLDKLVTDMRTALGDAVDGLTLASIGITTGEWEDKGKLNIDEQKLKDAIKNNPDKVTKLFSKESDIKTNMDLTAEEQKERYTNEGLAVRIFDVLENSIRTNRNKNGKVGLLLEKAGIEGHATEYTCILYKEIDDYAVRMKEMEKILEQKESSLYSKYSRLESLISSMNSQSSWLSSQFSSGS